MSPPPLFLFPPLPLPFLCVHACFFLPFISFSAFMSSHGCTNEKEAKADVMIKRVDNANDFISFCSKVLVCLKN